MSTVFRRVFFLVVGLIGGAVAVTFWAGRENPALAGSNDRHGDYIMCTGTVSTNPRAPTDGIWILDYRTGKLVGTVVDRTAGKVHGWAEVDLVSEFGLAPRADVHFLMTTGQISFTQSALYVAETTSGKFGVYTMAPRADGQPGVTVKRHDMVSFRASAPRDE